MVSKDEPRKPLPDNKPEKRGDSQKSTPRTIPSPKDKPGTKVEPSRPWPRKP